ncbi:YET1 [Candida oxycetoniae]|uniref:Endoplasmic reticulum transmembrane protein n=1 Tax=Candida oxycetoniae TaxID=497107 RepID=A0AAI9STN1_9ASCO|nr:YET1 [Candida oxycetoniae]KAI3402636.1 YET1 [Candida oxycetoniae]
MSLQFWDCYNRLKKFQHIDSSYGGDIGRGFVNYDRLASKFYSQRNLYLSGAILYLQMCIGTVVTIVKRLVIKEKELRDSELVEKKAEFEGVEMQKKRKDQERQETIKLKHLIELKQTDIDTLRKQLNGMQSAYDQLNAIESIKKDD